MCVDEREYGVGTGMLKTKKITPVDDHIAKRVRERRKAIRMTLQELASQLHVTFQQIQKYEAAANRIPASRLYEIAECLGVPINYFFEDYNRRR
jgi:transcriptional regulator with XRE-family HTH domain